MITPSLCSHPWRTSYRHEDGDLVTLFYIPALSRAVRYDRMTGYFSAGALALAARGIERLIANGGGMRLLVGCTLQPDEVRAIEQGYDLRDKVAENLARISLDPPDLTARQGLEALAWMVAAGSLDVKVAVPVRPDGRPTTAAGIYHEKVGILTDAGGNRLAFSGSINETAAGWLDNRESFHVHLSWAGERDERHCLDEVEAFERLWQDNARTVKVLDFPEAARKRLLEFLPTDDRRFARRPDAADGDEPKPPAVNRLMPDEARRAVWGFIRHAASLENGARVGEVTSTVRPWPHQLRTYARMLQNWPCRLLLADEVGLGKTISAGLLIRQVWLSGLARRILILTPKAVLAQWQNELYEKFNLAVPIYDGQRLIGRPAYGQPQPPDRRVAPDGWHREPIVLASSHLMRRRDRAPELLRAEPWDLAVLDEAHHARRKAAGSAQEGGPNALLRLMHGLKDRCRALLLLTATPMQVHPVEVWDLLALLGLPPRWAASSADFPRYFQTAAGNPTQADLEFLAALYRDTEATFGPLDDTTLAAMLPGQAKLARDRILKALREPASGIPLKRLSAADRAGALEVLRRYTPVRHRMARHTRDLLRQYHAKGLLDTPIARRDVRDVPVELSPAERALYDAVEDYISTTYNNAAPARRTAVGFVVTIYRRRLASSFYALRQTLNKHLEQISAGRTALLIDDEDLSQDEIAEDVQDAEDASELAGEALPPDERETILDLLRGIAKLGTDTKARRLRDELQQGFTDGYASAIVFTQYADTMDYLKEYLAAELPQVPIACYSGAGGQRRDTAGFWTACTKEEIKRAFKAGSIRLLVCTDAAGEGLNFQFSGFLVNYDLPWNPMKVEQRIGRIDRIGQKCPVIRVVNLAYKDTVEADVYFALGSRINLFEGIVGKLQPILSRLPHEFEAVALQRPEHREAARQRLLAEVDRMAREANEQPFDLDAAAQEALAMPELPAPPLTPEALEAVLSRPDLRPPGMTWSPLDAGSFAVTRPGMADPIRVTTRGEVFDDHPESHALLTPGNAIFDHIVRESAPDDSPQPDSTGHLWLIIPPGDHPACRVVVFTNTGPRTVATLPDLLAALETLGPPGRPETPDRPGAALKCLA